MRLQIIYSVKYTIISLTILLLSLGNKDITATEVLPGVSECGWDDDEGNDEIMIDEKFDLVYPLPLVAL